MNGFLIALGIAAGIVLMARFYWAFLLSMYPEQLNTNEIHTLVTPDLWKLRLCRYRRGRSGGEPILFVHGLGANQHNFTIPSDASLVDFLVGKGYDCWCIDLRGCRPSVPPFERRKDDVDIDDYLLLDLPAAVKYIKEATRYPKIHWVGHSLGGMLLYAYAQVFGDEDIASGTTMGAPLGFKDVDTQWLEDAVFFISRFPRVLGPCIRAFVPMRRRFSLEVPLFPTNLRNVADGLTSGEIFNVIDEPLPKVLRTMAGWASRKEWRMKHGELDMVAALTQLRLPLMAIYGPEDPFVPLEQAEAFFDALPHGHKKLLVLSKENGCQYNYSHCEQPFGKQARREVYEPVYHWLRKHAVSSPGRDFDGTEPAHLASMKPLDATARADILSGTSYAHLEPEADAVTAAPSAPKSRPAAKRTPAKRKARAAASKKSATKADTRVAKKSPAKPKTAAKRKPAAKSPKA